MSLRQNELLGGDKRGQMDYPLSIAGVVPVPFVPLNDVAVFVPKKKLKST